MVNHSSWDSEAPLVIAHRGASSLAPENTLSAFRLAVGMGADGIELDAKLSSDGVVVVHHDQTLDRTTDGTGFVRDRTCSELQMLDAGSKFDYSFRGEQIPTLDAVFSELGRSVLINVELTNYGSIIDTLVKRVVNLIHNHCLEDTVLFSSFNPLAIWQAARAAPRVRRALLVHASIPGILRSVCTSFLPLDDLHPAVQLVNSYLVDRQHARGRQVRVWTVNDRESMHMLFEMGVDGIITDVPDQAIKIREGTKRGSL